MTLKLDMQIWSKMENVTCVLTLIKMFTVHSVHTKVISMTYQKLWTMILVWCITVWLWTKANFANFRIRHHLIFSNLCQVTFHSKLSYPFILLCIFFIVPSHKSWKPVIRVFQWNSQIIERCKRNNKWNYQKNMKYSFFKKICLLLYFCPKNQRSLNCEVSKMHLCQLSVSKYISCEATQKWKRTQNRAMRRTNVAVRVT